MSEQTNEDTAPAADTPTPADAVTIDASDAAGTADGTTAGAADETVTGIVITDDDGDTGAGDDGAIASVETELSSAAETVVPEGAGTWEDDGGRPTAVEDTSTPRRRISFDVPDVQSGGYAATSFGINLTGEQARKVANLLEGLQRRGEPVTSAAAAIGWLIDRLGE